VSEQGTGCLHSRTRPLYGRAVRIGRQCRLCGAKMFEVSDDMAELADALARLNIPPDQLEESVRALVRAARGVALAFRDMGMDRSADVVDAALAPFAHLGGEP